MPVIAFEKTVADGAETKGGRGPSLVSAPSAASPELGDRPRRRGLLGRPKSCGYCARSTRRGRAASALFPRREGLYSSRLSEWRRQRDAGGYEALKSVKRGPEVEPIHPLASEHAQLQRDNKRLTLRLQRAEAIIEVQKKWLCCWAFRCPSTSRPDGRGGGPAARRRVDRRGVRGAGSVARQLPSPVRGGLSALPRRPVRARVPPGRWPPTNARPSSMCCANPASSIKLPRKFTRNCWIRASASARSGPCIGSCARTARSRSVASNRATPSTKSQN